MQKELVKDWMTREVITITPETKLPEAHRLMSDNNIRRLLVVEEDELVGIVTRGDVRGAEPSTGTSLNIWETNYILAKLEVREIMRRNPITIAWDATIGQASKMMLEKKISGLPVLDSKGKLTGIITESDIFRIVVQEWGRLE